MTKRSFLRFALALALAVIVCMGAFCWNFDRSLRAAPAKKPAKPKAAAPAPPPRPASAEFGRAINLPRATYAESQEVLDAAALYVLYELNYTEKTAAEGQWKLLEQKELQTRRFFRKDMPNNAYRTIELGMQAFSTRPGFIIVYAKEVSGQKESPNPDMPALLKRIEELTAQLQQKKAKGGVQNLDFEIIQLSYIQEDRALAALKIMGYNVVEFTRGAGIVRNVDFVFNPTGKPNLQNLPIIARMIDSEKNSLKDLNLRQGRLGQSLAPEISGSALDNVTAAAPDQRLIIIYDRANPEPLYRLLNLITEKIDVPEKQILLEGMVIEVRESKLRDLGITWQGVEGRHYTFSFTTPALNQPAELNTNYQSLGPRRISNFTAELRMLIRDGDAELLARPTVLALNNRQARIRVGEEVPITTSLFSPSATTQVRIEYFPIGIVLNIKPRANSDNTEVSMQVEAIVSARTGEELAFGQTVRAPYISTRMVQTFARVTDSTPFIIGGLVQRNYNRWQDRLPVFSRIPLIGNAFQVTDLNDTRNEVIIVLTPHVIPPKVKNFSYVIPKDSARFDDFGHILFRNAYRLRGDDVFDLNFLTNSDILKNLVKTVQAKVERDPSILKRFPILNQVLQGNIPGEDAVVTRMLYEIVKKLELYKRIATQNLIFFVPDEESPMGFRIEYLAHVLGQLKKSPGKRHWFTFKKTRSDNMVVLEYGVGQEVLSEVFDRPVASLRTEYVEDNREFERRFFDYNQPDEDGIQRHWAIVIHDEKDLIRLKCCLILKDLIKLNNPAGTLHLKNFKVGRKIMFPTLNETETKMYLIDHTVAKYFYQTEFYYEAFKREFNRTMDQIQKIVKELP